MNIQCFVFFLLKIKDTGWLLFIRSAFNFKIRYFGHKLLVSKTEFKSFSFKIEHFSISLHRALRLKDVNKAYNDMTV